jgi:hypothetical protein
VLERPRRVGGTAVGLPNRVRVAATSALIGLYSAIWRSPSGRPSIGTNALARNVSGNTVRNATPCTESGDRAITPTSVPSQIAAQANSVSRPKPATAWATSVWMRQPTISPLAVSTTSATMTAASSARKWPTRYAARDVGSDRKRSTIPSPRSVAMATPGPIIPNASVWIRMPPTRYSR